MDEYFDEGGYAKSMESGGYGYLSSGVLSNPVEPYDPGRNYGKYWTENDIIEMMVDCNQWTLSYKVGQKDYNKAFDIIPTEYKAAITIMSTNGCYTLLSYQEIF